MTSNTRTELVLADRSIQDDPDLGRRIEKQITRLARGRIRDLHVVCSQGRVILRGRARTHYAKQLAQHAALEITTGGSLFVNAIVVL